MEYATLNNGVKMPMAGIGTFLLTPDEAEVSCVSALQDGYRLIDTANAYVNAGWRDADIDKVLRIETPGNAFFNEKGIYNYHGGANVVFDDPDNLNWVISHSKG